MKWKYLIKKRAGWKSELSGRGGVLHAHHIAHKPNHYLKFHPENGIALTPHEHFRGVHGDGAEEYRQKIIDYIGQERWDRLHAARHGKIKVNLDEMERILDEELSRYT